MPAKKGPRINPPRRKRGVFDPSALVKKKQQEVKAKSIKVGVVGKVWDPNQNPEGWRQGWDFHERFSSQLEFMLPDGTTVAVAQVICVYI